MLESKRADYRRNRSNFLSAQPRRPRHLGRLGWAQKIILDLELHILILSGLVDALNACQVSGPVSQPNSVIRCRRVVTFWIAGTVVDWRGSAVIVRIHDARDGILLPQSGQNDVRPFTGVKHSRRYEGNHGQASTDRDP